MLSPSSVQEMHLAGAGRYLSFANRPTPQPTTPFVDLQSQEQFNINPLFNHSRITEKLVGTEKSAKIRHLSG